VVYLQHHSCSVKTRGWSSDPGLWRLWNSLDEGKPSRQPVSKRVSKQAEVKNSLKALAFVDCDDYHEYDNFVRP
jgi:hypothetical protein